MKLVLKFKDGLVVNTNMEGMFFGGNGNFLDLLQQAKDTNGPVRVELEDRVIERTFNEVHSVEIIL